MYLIQAQNMLTLIQGSFTLNTILVTNSESYFPAKERRLSVAYGTKAIKKTYQK
jgi:hypothetical protein